MNGFRKRFAGAALFFSLAAGGALLAQDDNRKSDVDGLVPPVVGVPAAGDVIPRDGSSRDWRGEVEADREAKGWSRSRPRGQSNSRQNWSRQYQDRFYGGGEDRFDRFRDPQHRSDRIGQNRSNFTPLRPDARSNAEIQAQAYAAMYWMMKAQAEQEQAEAEEGQARRNQR